jgi:2'-5' RNA ligase
MRAGSRPDLRDYVSREGLAQLTAAATEHTGAMIALLPSEEDAARLALDSGEPEGELHCTLWFLGEAASWTDDQRNELIAGVSARAATLGGPVHAHLFGVNHWNPSSDDPAWVWAAGDDMEADEPGLLGARWVAQDALEDTHARPETPRQHSPWVAHITATYTADTRPLAPMIERLGPVVFDRIRVAFGGDHTDIPLTGSVTAAAGPLRRQPTDLEAQSRVDFAAMDQAWHQAVDDTIAAWADIQAAQRDQITAAVQAAAEADDLDRLDGLTVDTGPAADLLTARMIRYAREAGEAQQAEAEAQGVSVPEWSLDDEALVAAAFRDRIRQVARTTARLLGAGLVASGVRAAMRLFGSGSPRQVAGQVDDHLAGLSDSSVREAVGGAMSAAQHEGRMAVLAVAPPGTYVASEALDKSSCQPCRQVDGTRYASLAEARAAYPTGGYTGCLGGARCRGFVVAVWNEDDEDDEQAAAGTIMALAAATIPPNDHEQGGTVYRTVQDHPDCGADTPWAVTDDEGELQGCYATQAEADAACAGMDDGTGEEEKPDDESMDYAGQTAPWEGPLAVEGIVTGDGREFAPGALTWADLPIPLRWNKEDSHGGEPRTIAVNVGRIDEVWRDGERIMGRGVLDLSDEDGRRVHAKIEGKFLRGVSIDADSIADADTEFVWPDDVNAGTGDDEGEPDMFEMLFAQPEKVIFHGGRIRAATLVDIPAFAEAYIALLDEAGAVVAGGQPVTEQELQALVVQELGAVAVHETATSDGDWDGPANEKRLTGPLTVDKARAAYAWYDGGAETDGELPKSACKFLHHDIREDGTVGPANLAACSATIAALHGARGGTSIPAADRRGVYDHVAAHLRDAGKEPEPFRALHAVTAGAEVWRPPAEWFTDPKLSLPTPITVTDDGRIYGHAAQWGSCHIGQDDVCVQPPHEDQHPYYRTGEVVCADGSRVAVGQITVGTGHAPLHLGAVPAAEHYDNTGAAVADVAVGNDANGIWVAGCVRPGADPLKVYELQAAGQVSGDWRRIGGQLRLVGLLAVNVPGFPVPKMRARVASGEPQALLAAGRPTVAWGRSQTEMEREAVRIVMRMLSRRVHPGGR